MTLDDIYEKLQHEKREREESRKRKEQLIIERYSHYIKFLENERRLSEKSLSRVLEGGISRGGIGVMVVNSSQKNGNIIR